MNKHLLIFLALVGQLAFSQIKEQITTDKGRTFWVGNIGIDDLKKAPYGNWFLSNYEQYKPNHHLLEQHQEELKKYHILLFMGTWCSDSKREVPRMAKLLDALDFPGEQLKIVAVDRRKEFYKKSPGGEEWGLDIRRVPTIILLKDGKEENRIVESPVETLEEDILQILNGKDYIPNYSTSKE